MIFPFLLVGGGVALVAYLLAAPDDGPVPVHEPDLPPGALPPPGMPRSTGYRLVDAILGELQKAADSSGIPLGLLVGWVARESGGRLGETTKLDERGYFQLMPSESKALELDHQRLTTDSTYSINAGLALIGKYMGEADRLGIAARGTSFYWRIVKLLHTMGSGAVHKIVDGARAAGAAGSWEALEQHATSHDADYLHATKHSPKKWFPLVDKVFQVGKPFGFGSDAVTLVGEAVYTDIPDVLNLLWKRK